MTCANIFGLGHLLLKAFNAFFTCRLEWSLTVQFVVNFLYYKVYDLIILTTAIQLIVLRIESSAARFSVGYAGKPNAQWELRLQFYVSVYLPLDP